MNERYGRILAPGDVEGSVIDTLRLWLPSYVPATQRDRGLGEGAIQFPPAPESIHGGLDMLSWVEDTLPEIIVVVNPAGAIERTASAGVCQTFEVQVGVITAAEDEDGARLAAGYLAAAATATLTEQVPPIAGDMVLVDYPRLSFPDPETRRLVQAVSVFGLFVANVLSEGGPLEPSPTDPGPWPTVRSVQITVAGRPLTVALS